MSKSHSRKKEYEELERRIEAHPFYRMRREMDKYPTYGCDGEELSRAEHKQAEIFWRHWNNGVRDWLKEQGQHGTVSLDDIDDGLIDSIEFCNILVDVDILLLNTGMYEERLSFYKDLLEFFDWRNDPSGAAGFKADIGESLEKMDKHEECDRYFETLLREEPENVTYINMYLNCLCYRKSYEEAKELLEKHMNPDIDVTEKNDLLFWRAEEIYEGLGDDTLSSFYREKRKTWEANQTTTLSPMSSDAAEFLAENPDIAIELGAETDMDTTATKLSAWKMLDGEILEKGTQKIYPNDPCPCGSGKKFKRCCGKMMNI